MARRRGKLTVLAVGVVGAAAVAGAAWTAGVEPYAVSTHPDYTVKPILSVGDTVPETGDPSKRFQMVGIPDGLGGYRSENGRDRRATLFMSHELGFTAQSRPVIGEDLNRGAIVSKLTLDGEGNVLHGERAYDTVYLGETYVGPAATVGNSTPAFARFCSASLAGEKEGFDRWIYFANEEAEGTSTFDGKGGLSVAIFDNKAYGLPDLGHFAWEQTIAQPNAKGDRVVLIGMEDGPSNLDASASNSQVYMYVGTKDPASSSPLRRNGLVGGKLYMLAPVDAAMASEKEFRTGSIEVKWVEIPGAGSLTDVQLETAADAAGAFRFARPEDAAFNDDDRNQVVFVTTGESRIGGAPTNDNKLGRVYELDLKGSDVTENGRLKVAVNADDVFAAGGDTAISPDNIDVGQGYLMVQEDGTTTSRAAMAAKGRDGSIWRFEIDEDGVDASSATRVVELDPPGRDGTVVGPGVWETSGIIDGEKLFGSGSWVFDVQAHPGTGPRTPVGDITVEDGQLLLLTEDDEDDEDDD